MSDALWQVLRSDGIRGLYRGFSAAAVGGLPGNAAYFGGYELSRALVPAGSGAVGDMAVGAGAQLIAGVVFTPVDIIKERMQVQGVRGITMQYGSPVQALRAIVTQQGLGGLLKGYWATNAAKAAAGAVLLPPELASSPCPEEHLPPWALAAASASAAAAAALATHPADVVKTRLQVLPPSSAATARSVAAQLLRTEGTAALMRGAGARMLMLAPGAALSWAIYEPVKAALSARLPS